MNIYLKLQPVIFVNMTVQCKTSCRGKDLLSLLVLMKTLKNMLSCEYKFPFSACPGKIGPPTHSESLKVNWDRGEKFQVFYVTVELKLW